MKQPEEAAAEAEPERGGGFRLVDKRGVVQRQLVERVAQFRVGVAVERVEPGEDHRFRVGVAGQRLRGGMARDGHRVAYPCLPDVLHASDQVTDLASAERSTRLRLRRDHADLKRLVRRTRCHHQAALAGGQATIDHADVGDDAPVGVVDRVEDQRPRRGLRVTGGRRDVLHDGVQEFGHTLARLGRDPEHFGRVAADDPCQLTRVGVRLGGGQVDLVEDRDDPQVGVERQVQVGEGLRFDSLHRVDKQDRTLAGRERPRDLVGEVDVPRGVDEVENIAAPVCAGPG